MHLWGGVREVLRVHDILEGNRSKPREGASYTGDGVIQDREGSPKAHRKDSNAQQVHLKSDRQMPALLQDIKAGLCLDRRV